MLAYSHPTCLQHDTGPDHPEQPARLQVVLDALRQAWPDQAWLEAPAARRGDLLRVHAPSLVDEVLAPVSEGLHRLDPDTVVCPASGQAALHAAGAGVAAVDAVMAGQDLTAFCAVRPPGHHATADAAMGFCLFNNIAVAAAHARDQHGLERIAIIAFDVHHGNGTQAIFEQDRRLLFASSHQWPLYPGSGAGNETGAGNIVNAPLPADADGTLFRAAWTETLLPAIDAFRPQLLLVSAGFDAHRRDPLAQLRLEAEDYAWITRELVRLANRHCGGRIVSSLEGGYDLEALRESVVAHVGELLT